MAATVKWVVVKKPLASSGDSGSYAEIADATTIISVVDNHNGTLTILYV